jgi:hypothetical protein
MALRAFLSPRWFGRALFAWTLCVVLPVGAQPPSPTEFDVKAAFLYNFGKFVQWPAPAADVAASTFTVLSISTAASPSNSEPFTIGVLGTDPFKPGLEKRLAGKTIQDRTVDVKVSQNIDDLRDCRIIYIAPGAEQDTAYVLGRLADKPVLTVGEGKRFFLQGGMVSFQMESRRIRFDINLQRVRAAGLDMSSQLIRLGRTVTGAEAQ